MNLQTEIRLKLPKTGLTEKVLRKFQKDIKNLSYLLSFKNSDNKGLTENDMFVSKMSVTGYLNWCICTTHFSLNYNLNLLFMILLFRSWRKLRARHGCYNYKHNSNVNDSNFHNYNNYNGEDNNNHLLRKTSPFGWHRSLRKRAEMAEQLQIKEESRTNELCILERSVYWKTPGNFDLRYRKCRRNLRSWPWIFDPEGPSDRVG